MDTVDDHEEPNPESGQPSVGGRAGSRSAMEIHDPQVMRAMAHPARLTIMQYLSDGRAITATECAEVCGLSPSAMSYHLRALAKVGMIEEAPSRGDKRERVWRSAVLRFTVSVQRGASEETQEAERKLIEAMLAADNAVVCGWLARNAAESEEWYEAAAIHRSRLVLTAAELTDLTSRIAKLLDGYRRRERSDPPEGSREVAFSLRALPLD